MTPIAVRRIPKSMMILIIGIKLGID